MKDEEMFVNAIVAGIVESKLTPKQVRTFGNAFARALGYKPPTTKEIEDYERSSMEAN
mgnify:CR=1 FL=1|jgi:hypothetical protein